MHDRSRRRMARCGSLAGGQRTTSRSLSMTTAPACGPTRSKKYSNVFIPTARTKALARIPVSVFQFPNRSWKRTAAPSRSRIACRRKGCPRCLARGSSCACRRRRRDGEFCSAHSLRRDERMTSATVHASAVLVGARAVLIRGPSGSGKSRLVLDLVAAARGGALRFARLVGDDRVHVEPAHGRLLVRPAAALAGLIELRGAGILKVPYEPSAVVGLVVDLAAAAERLPDGE